MNKFYFKYLLIIILSSFVSSLVVFEFINYINNSKILSWLIDFPIDPLRGALASLMLLFMGFSTILFTIVIVFLIKNVFFVKPIVINGVVENKGFEKIAIGYSILSIKNYYIKIDTKKYFVPKSIYATISESKLVTLLYHPKYGYIRLMDIK